MPITITTTNVFRGRDQLGATIKNLAEQTDRDFEWVLVDAFYDLNRELVAEMCDARGMRDVVHVPFAGNTNVGAAFTWASYNDAALLARHPVILRVGVFRFIHPEVTAIVADSAARDTWVSLTQRPVDRLDDKPSADLAAEHGLDVTRRAVWDRMTSHCGMFSRDTETLIGMNGNSEAQVLHHAEDCDWNARWQQLGPQNLVALENAMLRVYHSKCPTLTYVPKPVCRRDDNPACIYHAANNHELKKYAHPDTEWRDHEGFPWARCRTCGTVANGYCDEYYEYLKTDLRGFRAPVGVFGTIGRDLLAVRDDLAKLTSLQSKVELLAWSHTDPKYLVT